MSNVEFKLTLNGRSVSKTEYRVTGDFEGIIKRQKHNGGWAWVYTPDEYGEDKIARSTSWELMMWMKDYNPEDDSTWSEIGSI